MTTNSVFHTLNTVFESEVENIVNSSQNWVTDPSRDFSRRRSQLDFETVFKAPFYFDETSVYAKLSQLLSYSEEQDLPPWDSALSMARRKILPEAYMRLFFNFNEKTRSDLLFNGYNILAVDGSEQGVTGSCSSKNLVGISKDGSHRRFVHINALYDVLEKTYIDAIVQPGAFRFEDEALLELAASHPELLPCSVFTADRGYESLILFYRLEQLGAKFVIRIKDYNSYNSIIKGYGIQEDDSLDTWLSLILTKDSTKRKRCPYRYKYLWNYQNIPEFDSASDLNLNLRIVRFPIEKEDGSVVYECLATNLAENEFPADDLKQVYRLRWNEETSFNHLKNKLDISKLKSRTLEGIEQELFAKMTLYNLSSRIKNLLDREKEGSKYRHTINLSNVIFQIIHFLFNMPAIGYLNIDDLIRRETVPLIPGRPDTRKRRARTKKSSH